MLKRKTRETIDECSCCNTGMILGGIAIAATLVMSIATFCNVAFIKENILLQA